MNENKFYNILLLTNRDSDNLGDQVIEACDISLISAVMKNLNIDSDHYKISSRAAAIVTQDYLATRKPELLKTARNAISKADLVIFGGAPVFNYLYQNFYDRTAVTLELAQEYNVPVIFSAVGVERYDQESKRCQRLKKTLNFDCVKQITTRDDYAVLEKYITNPQTVIGRVSDPAVFTFKVFEKFRSTNVQKKRKKIGIFVLRANGFVDNKVDFPSKKAAVFWKNLGKELKAQGYDYEYVTSGHFGDEAFLDCLMRKYGFEGKKCIMNMNTPEKLISKISSYDGVITCRLHPSIISFSLDVPSLGIVWNTKVKNFYKGIGYEDRIVETEGIDPKEVVKKLELAMEQGVKKDEDFMLSVYSSLFSSIKNIVCADDDTIRPYNYEELLEALPPYKGTSKKEEEEKLRRKFQRAYRSFNERSEKIEKNKKTISELREEIEQLKIQHEMTPVTFIRHKLGILKRKRKSDF